MTNKDIVENVTACFEMEGFVLTEEDKERGLAILKGEIDVEQVVEDIKNKYTK